MAIRRVTPYIIATTDSKIYVNLKDVIAWSVINGHLELHLTRSSFGIYAWDQEDLDNLVRWKSEIEESLMMR